MLNSNIKDTQNLHRKNLLLKPLTYHKNNRISICLEFDQEAAKIDKDVGLLFCILSSSVRDINLYTNFENWLELIFNTLFQSGTKSICYLKPSKRLFAQIVYVKFLKYISFLRGKKKRMRHVQKEKKKKRKKERKEFEI